MSDLPLSDQDNQALHPRRGAVSILLTSAVLFTGSAVLQFIASGQRWVVFAGSRAAGDISVEDHIFDYYFPGGDWEPIGTAAQFVGAGILISAFGILVMAIGMLLTPGAPRGWRTPIAAAELVLATAIAASLGVGGAHALISGFNGAPSALQDYLALSHVGFFGLIALALLWLRRLPAATAACLFLLGSTLVGYLVSTFLIAPLIAGETSHDTTRWTETVVAATTAGAAVTAGIAARRVARRGDKIRA